MVGRYFRGRQAKKEGASYLVGRQAKSSGALPFSEGSTHLEERYFRGAAVFGGRHPFWVKSRPNLEEGPRFFQKTDLR